MNAKRVVHTARRATGADHDKSSEVLANAFASDPVMSWLIGQRPDIEDRLQHHYYHELGRELTKPEPLVDVVEGRQAVALWHEVDDWKTPLTGLVRAAPAAIRTFQWHVPRALRLLTMLEKAHPKAPHRHLAYIGVHRDHQGTGLGGALLTSMTAECDEQGLAAYLESSDPRNDALYARHGFVATGEIELPRGAPRIMAMWRDAR
jgi:GNAT superfamily N-acetyltransferase